VRTTRAVWQRGSVRSVVLAFASITVGEWILGTTVAIHAYEAGGAVLVGLVGFRFAPASVASLFSHRLVARFRRERILIGVALVRLICGAGVALSLWRGVPWVVPVGLVWLDAAAGSAYRPAQAALLPALVGTPGELTAATALVSNAKSVGQLLGALLGSVLVSTLPIGLAVGAAPLLYLIGLLCTSGIRAPRLRPSIGTERVLGVLARVRSGANALFIDREASELTVLSVLRSLVRGLWIALGVVAAETVLGLGRAGFGWLMAAAMGGAGLSLLLTSRLSGTRALVPWFAGGLLFCGVPVALIGLTATGGWAIGLMVVWGFGMALADAVGQALLFRVVPAPQISRASGAMESGKLLFTGVGSIVAPGILAVFGIRGALVAAGALVPAGMVILITVIRPSVLPRIQRRAERRTDVLELLARVPLFSPLRLEAIEAVAARLQPVEASTGTDIVTHRQRDDGGWYLVRTGELAVLIDGFEVQRIGPGASFGELGLLRDAPRTATVRALTPVSLFRLDRRAFLESVAGDEVDTLDLAVPVGGTDDPLEVLRHMPLLRDLAHRQLVHLLRDATSEEHSAGDVVTAEGEHDDRYFVVLSGRAEATGRPGDGGREWCQELLPGDGFGEIAVVHRIPRTATVRATERTQLLAVPGSSLRAALETRPEADSGPASAAAGAE
jgi:CRP-like cAMP-binding protein